MATVGEIERLKKLLDQLLPLSKRDAGDVIAARDWNTVVGALLEVARAVVATDATRAVPTHDHPDQVRLGWLEPRLRALVERGPMDDPVAIGRIGAVERGVGAVDKRLDELVSSLRDVRTSASRLEVSDLGREATITRLNRKVDGLDDAREDVTQVRETLDAVRDDLTSVLRFAAGLGSVTPVALLEGLSAVNDLRERLTTPSGALLDASEFERRLVELSTTLVTEEELAEALDDVRARIPEDVRASLLEAARAAALTQTQQVVDALGEQLTEQIAARLGEVSELATEAAREEAARIADALRGTLRDELTSTLGELIADGDAAVRAELRQAVAEATAAAQSLVDGQVSALRDELPGLVGDEVTRRQPDIVASVQAAIAPALTKFGNRVTKVETDMVALQQAQVATATDLAELRQKTASDLDRLSSELRKQFDKDLTNAVEDLKSSQKALDERLHGEMAVEQRRVDEIFEEIRRQLEEIRRKIGMKDTTPKDTDKPERLEESSVEVAEEPDTPTKHGKAKSKHKSKPKPPSDSAE